MPRCTSPIHLIGLELSISVLNAALRDEPTGCSAEWRGDAVATAKRALKAGEMLDGEGGYTVYGKLIPAKPLAGARCAADRARPPSGSSAMSRRARSCPRADVELDERSQAVRIRRQMVAEAAKAREAA